MQGIYRLSFVVVLTLVCLAFIATGASVVFQARLTAGKIANWNVFIVVGSYVAFAFVSLMVYANRKYSNAQKLKAIPKGYVAIKEGDVAKRVSSHVAFEYNRACAIVYVSQPPPAEHEGWGIPGSRYEGVYLRRGMLDTIAQVDNSARSLASSLPDLRPHQSLLQHLQPFSSLIASHEPALIAAYSALIEQARYDEREPSEKDYEICLVLAARLIQIFTFFRNQLEASKKDEMQEVVPGPDQEQDVQSWATSSQGTDVS